MDSIRLCKTAPGPFSSSCVYIVFIEIREMEKGFSVFRGHGLKGDSIILAQVASQLSEIDAKGAFERQVSMFSSQGYV